MNELIIYWLVNVALHIVRVLPVSAALALGAGFGRIAYVLDGKRRRVILANLRTAFARSKTPSEIRLIAKQTFLNLALSVVELLRYSAMTDDEFKKYIHLEGKEHIDRAMSQGKGAIFLTVHSGSWELASRTGAILGYPYKVLVRPQQKHARLMALLNRIRRTGGADVVERGSGTRTVLRSLKNNEIVAMVADQGGRDGALVPFFGKEASMSTGAVRIALKTGTPILITYIQRVRGGQHKLTVSAPFELTRTDDPDHDVIQNLTRIVKIMEDRIAAAPAEYMWFYKIWKYSRDVLIMIVTDGKAGHLRQAEAVGSLLKSALAERGYAAKIPIVRATFRSGLWRNICSFCCVTANLLRSPGRHGLLRQALKDDSYVQVMSVKPDFVISCGSSVAPVNYLLAREHNAKSIAILKPGMLYLRAFDLVVLPEHDVYKKKWPSYVTVTHGAPNLITPRYLSEQTESLLRRFSHLKTGDNLRIGVLIGGDTDEFTLSESKIRVLLHQLIETAEETRSDILLTTSRRTPAKVENLIAREMRKYPRCKFLVLASRDQVPEAVGGILGLSDVIVVSGDSISMVSEAASSGKKVVSFFVDSKVGRPFEMTKHGRFLEGLANDGYLLVTDVKAMKDSLYKLIKNSVATKTLNDNAIVLNALEKLI